MTAPKRPRGEQPGSEQGIGESLSSTSVRREGPPGEDTAFMEEILIELSTQNENARAESGQRSTAPAAPAADASATRPRTVRVERDSEFRTAEGVPSARAYLPAKTLAPGRKEPVDTETVRVEDPRRLPTVRLSREAKETASTAGTGRKPRAQPAAARTEAAGPGALRTPASDDNAPTLRSASPLAAGARVPETKMWIGWVVVAAIAGVLLVALAARFRSAPVRPPPPSTSPAVIQRAGDVPPPGPVVSSGSPAPGATPPSSVDVAPTAAVTQEPSARPRPVQKSDRWF